MAYPFATLAEQLPIKTYTVSDGLIGDYVNRMILDSYGFLWFCTSEGLSRFDGYGFSNYGPADGLKRSVRDLLQAKDGSYWIATAAGLYRFDLASSKQAGSLSGNQRSLSTRVAATRGVLELYRPADGERARDINTVKQDRSGVIWCGTDGGLYRLDQVQGGWKFSAVNIGLPTNRYDDTIVSTILEDHRGAMWIGTGSGLFQRLPDGSVKRYTTRDGLPFNDVRALLEDRDGRLWVGTTLGLAQLQQQADSSAVVVGETYTTSNGLAHNWITSLLQTADARLWVGTIGGLSEWLPNATQRDQTFRSYTDAEGLSTNVVQSLAEDGDGELWVGTESGGAMKLARNGFASYGNSEGLSDTRIASIFEDRAGELCVISGQNRDLFIHRFDGRRFTVTKPHTPRQTNYGWGWNQTTFQDSAGEWWLSTAEGLYRFPQASHVEQLGVLNARAIYKTRDGLTGDQVFRLYEDARGDIWISTLDKEGSTLTRWERASDSFHRYTSADGMPSTAPTAFRENASGDLWIGFYDGGLVRYRSGRFTRFTTGDGVPEGMVRDLYFDRAGQLWIAAGGGGVVHAQDTMADRPHFVTLTTAQGLASNLATCITEDEQGRIYIGSPHGVDRLDIRSGQIKHYSMADGLARNFVNVAFRDRAGALWFGTLQGLSRLVPEPDVNSAVPSIFINGLWIAGEDYPVSPLGQLGVAGPELSANQNDVQIDFSSISIGGADSLRYQYKLEGADSNWSAPSMQRSITYAHLAPGSYRFQVRAVNVDGVASAQPAFVSFTILRPIWQRWWFVTLAVLFAAGAAAILYKYRVNHLLEVERVRTRIATDLHDDIGASLSRMAILSEVVKLQNDGRNERSARMLTDISDSARSLVDSMSDIVWSIDPRRDDLQSVVRRVRQFAADILETQGIKWELLIAADLQQVKLQPEERRHLFLIFKEALTNIARHAGCTSVLVRLTVVGHQLRAEINDDGKGFVAIPRSEPGANGRGGHGVENMRARAAQLRGRLKIDSTVGVGTRLTLTMPLAEQHGMNMLFARWRR